MTPDTITAAKIEALASQHEQTAAGFITAAGQYTNQGYAGECSGYASLHSLFADELRSLLPAAPVEGVKV